MQVIAGTARGTKLDSVPGDTTRPILDRVKKSVFDILRPELPGMSVLDLFGGSGSVGIEALSQGAERCIFCDTSKAACDTIRKNLERTHLLDKAEVRHFDAFRYLTTTSKSFSLIYVAPPQYKALWIEAIRTIAERPELLTADGLVIAQIDPSEYEELGCTYLREDDRRRYGNTELIFYRRGEPGETSEDKR